MTETHGGNIWFRPRRFWGIRLKSGARSLKLNHNEHVGGKTHNRLAPVFHLLTPRPGAPMMTVILPASVFRIRRPVRVLAFFVVSDDFVVGYFSFYMGIAS
jgi:hypothetical protein